LCSSQCVGAPLLPHCLLEIATQHASLHLAVAAVMYLIIAATLRL
jgi:hypothetical protein